ncbi:ATP12 family chaperone protein [Sphingobium boeckii]|uniref:Chaperone required for assembly of F1-ATPase n=1 Tax=Sphingobium boeckii TaxID=1082345 RepID=A0A7W9EDV7_9SPHN|nr:ATP12 family protein [Sphingobium boeckii]MBB5684365.1 chaperone required for assembly of F1-ATPase [Sphingobium boeckii]
MKRFYKDAAATPDRGVALDGRPVRTPGKALLAVPTDALADAIAAEWHAQGEDIDPRSMHLTGLANAAIDRVAGDPATFAAGLSAYGESDLLCYRAESPQALVSRQSAAWDPLLNWAAERFDVAFAVISGVMHAHQPAATVARLAAVTAARDSFALAGLFPLVTISGSLIAALAISEEAFDADAVWDAVTVDERWQAENWGVDALEAKTQALRRRDFMAATRFLELLR